MRSQWNSLNWIQEHRTNIGPAIDGASEALLVALYTVNWIIIIIIVINIIIIIIIIVVVVVVVKLHHYWKDTLH